MPSVEPAPAPVDDTTPVADEGVQPAATGGEDAASVDAHEDQAAEKARDAKPKSQAPFFMLSIDKFLVRDRFGTESVPIGEGPLSAKDAWDRWETLPLNLLSKDVVSVVVMCVAVPLIFGCLLALWGANEKNGWSFYLRGLLFWTTTPGNWICGCNYAWSYFGWPRLMGFILPLTAALPVCVALFAIPTGTDNQYVGIIIFVAILVVCGGIVCESNFMRLSKGTPNGKWGEVQAATVMPGLMAMFATLLLYDYMVTQDLAGLASIIVSLVCLGVKAFMIRSLVQKYKDLIYEPRRAAINGESSDGQVPQGDQKHPISWYLSVIIVINIVKNNAALVGELTRNPDSTGYLTLVVTTFVFNIMDRLGVVSLSVLSMHSRNPQSKILTKVAGMLVPNPMVDQMRADRFGISYAGLSCMLPVFVSRFILLGDLGDAFYHPNVGYAVLLNFAAAVLEDIVVFVVEKSFKLSVSEKSMAMKLARQLDLPEHSPQKVQAKTSYRASPLLFYFITGFVMANFQMWTIAMLCGVNWTTGACFKPEPTFTESGGLNSKSGLHVWSWPLEC